MNNYARPFRKALHNTPFIIGVMMAMGTPEFANLRFSVVLERLSSATAHRIQSKSDQLVGKGQRYRIPTPTAMHYILTLTSKNISHHLLVRVIGIVI